MVHIEHQDIKKIREDISCLFSDPRSIVPTLREVECALVTVIDRRAISSIEECFHAESLIPDVLKDVFSQILRVRVSPRLRAKPRKSGE